MLKNRSIIKFLFLTVILFGIMISAVIGLRVYAETSIRKERSVYLSAQSVTTANLIDKIISRYTDYSRIFRHTIEEQLETGEDIDTIMAKLNQALYLSDARLILVDESGTWYGNHKTSGRISALEYYTHTSADELVYITTGIDVDIESFCYRTKLSEPFSVRTSNGNTNICFFTLIYYMNYLNEEIKASFPYTCNSFIVNDTGLMLYKNFELSQLMNGSNIFSKYERVTFLDGASGSQLVDKIKNKETVAVEMLIENQHFFICTSPLSVNDWYVSFVVESSDLSAGSYVNSMFIYILLIGLIFAISLGCAGVLLLRFRDSSRLYEKEKAANEFLEKASKAKGEFMSNMSHDIRTPINGIMGMTKIAQSENNPPRTVDCLKKIEISSNYLLSLVSDVLEMSNIEDGNLKIRQEAILLNSYLEECISVIKIQAENKKITLETDFSSIQHPNILSDPLRLNQIFINILGNAVKFTPEGGTVSFLVKDETIESVHPTFVFQIQDNGIGMEKDFLTHIWDRFSQSAVGSRSEYKGTGLGMAITKTLVDAMGGSISVESEVGVGSIFTIHLSFDEDVHADTNVTEEQANCIQGMRLLLVEDNEINMEIATELLSGEGAFIEQAFNGKEAWDQYEAHEAYYYDVILMDMMMPELNGLEATKKIRESRKQDALKIPIIAMTANVLENDIAAMKAVGINQYLGKPIDMKAVLSVLSSYKK